MKNTEIRIFYSWQSDLPNSETRGLIQDSISSAVKMLRDTVEIEADRDTKGEYGSPDIVQTIFSKIDECDIFIADVSIVNKYSSITDEGENGNVRYGPNPNVMLELGYAASVVGWENVICILDTDYGSPDDLPFDLAHHRLSPYSLKEKTKKDVKKYIRDIITDTVSNLLENGPRVKSNFSNLVVGCYNQESNEITKEAWSYSPFEYFDSVIKDRGIAGCKQLISEINDIHLEPCIVEEPKEQPQVSSNISEMLGSINLFGDTPQRVIITEKEKECFDTVLFKDKLTVTFRVKRKEEINVLDLANFVLCAARLLSDDKPETVQVKTTLHSPGDVILQIWNFAQENAFPLLICYTAIFGGKVGDYEFHSIIGVIKGIINHKYDEDKKKIELRKLSAEADLAEQQALKQKLENIETMRRLQLSSVDAYAEPLATAAKNLAVQPSSATIIDITKILKSQQEDQPPQ